MDYRPVVVPDFVQEAGAVREILRAAGDFSTEVGEAIYFKGYREGLGSLDMVFRVVPATLRLLGEDGDTALVDQKARPVRLYEGIVLRGEGLGGGITQEQLDAVHAYLEPSFRQFWESKDWQPLSSKSIELPPTRGDVLRLTQKESPTLPDAPRIYDPESSVNEYPEHRYGMNVVEASNTEEPQKKNARKRSTSTFEEDIENTEESSQREPNTSKIMPSDMAGGSLVAFGLIVLLLIVSRGIIGQIVRALGIIAAVFGVILVLRSFSSSSKR